MQKAHTTQLQKGNKPIEKIDRIPKQTILLRRHTDGQQAHEKTLNITNYQRNANQKYNEVPPHSSPNGYHLKSLQMLERMWRKGKFLHCWQECKLVQLLWKTGWRFPKKLKIDLPYDPAIPLLDIYADKTKIQRHMHPYIHSRAIYNIQDMETS